MSAFTFCPRCGSQLLIDAAHPHASQKCLCCGTTHYHNSKPTVGALIVSGDRVLLAERAIDPHRGDWDIPGGFLEAGEDPEAGIRREIREETGLEIDFEGPFAILIDRYPYAREVDYTLNIYYVARVTHGTPTPADDVALLRWFPIAATPENLAFEHTHEVIRRLRERILTPSPSPRGGEG